MKFRDFVVFKKDKEKYLNIELNKGEYFGSIISENKKDDKWQVAFMVKDSGSFIDWFLEEDLKI